MTFAVGMFPGDTHAGWKKPYRGSAEPWCCECDAPERPNAMTLKTNPGYLAKCPDCKQERPA